MILLDKSCVDTIMHRNVQFNRCEQSYQIFKCPTCGIEILEAEDTGCGG